MDIKGLLQNPIVVFFLGLAALWLFFKILKIFVSFFGLFLLAFVVLFFVNARFRHLVKNFFANIAGK
jgi:hypothetical protein